MKTIITNSSVLIIVNLLLTSCFTSVSFNKPAPPEIMLEEPKNNIAFINAFDYTIYKAEEEIGHLAKIVGEEYVKKFSPGTELVNRKIYVGKGLLEADNYCMEQNWDKAIELLRPLAESPDPKISRKAANNLSVAYEAIGNEKAAEFWFNKSMEGGK
jgi:hypothetical protein